MWVVTSVKWLVNLGLDAINTATGKVVVRHGLLGCGLRTVFRRQVA
jgi:hypothetical protein